jgi:glycosyltransferase involved in cell wall biosynthesis
MGIFQRYVNQQIDIYAKCPDQYLRSASVFVVIPCYNEPDLLTTLNSLAACHPPVATVSVIVVINDGADAPREAVDQNVLTLKCIEAWQRDHPDLFFDVQQIYAHSLPQKWAGVGWARKIGMDEAVRQIDQNNLSDGIITSFDADSTVMPNYLQAIESAFRSNPAHNFFTIHFEHPFNNQELTSSLREGIIRYELHMRYYRNALQWCGYPNAIHTVGSSFALRASAYVKQGGMNRRKAGEDFYFLHKLVLLGNYGNITTTTVFPASRCSDRVPFGTGAAMKKWIEGGTELFYTYSLEAFSYLKPLFASPCLFREMGIEEINETFGHLHPILQSWCENSKIIDQMVELKNNCSNTKVFEKRFFHLFNAFWIMKYLNFSHENTLIRGDLEKESLRLLQYIGIQTKNNISPEEILEIFRDLDKSISCYN